MDILQRHMVGSETERWCRQGYVLWQQLSISEDTAMWLQRHARAISVFQRWYDERPDDAPCSDALFNVVNTMHLSLTRLVATTSFCATDSYMHYDLLRTVVAECWGRNGERERFMAQAPERQVMWEALLLEQIRRPHECTTPRGATTLERLMMERHRFEPGAGFVMWLLASDVRVATFVRMHWPDWHRRWEQACAVVDVLHENVVFNQRVRLVVNAMDAHGQVPVEHTVPEMTN